MSQSRSVAGESGEGCQTPTFGAQVDEPLPALPVYRSAFSIEPPATILRDPSLRAPTGGQIHTSDHLPHDARPGRPGLAVHTATIDQNCPSAPPIVNHPAYPSDSASQRAHSSQQSEGAYPPAVISGSHPPGTVSPRDRSANLAGQYTRMHPVVPSIPVHSPVLHNLSQRQGGGALPTGPTASTRPHQPRPDLVVKQHEVVEGSKLIFSFAPSDTASWASTPGKQTNVEVAQASVPSGQPRPQSAGISRGMGDQPTLIVSLAPDSEKSGVTPLEEPKVIQVVPPMVNRKAHRSEPAGDHHESHHQTEAVVPPAPSEVKNRVSPHGKHSEPPIGPASAPQDRPSLDPTGNQAESSHQPKANVSFAPSDDGGLASAHTKPHEQEATTPPKVKEDITNETSTPQTSGGTTESEASPSIATPQRPAVNPCPLKAFNAVLIPTHEWAEIRYPLWPAALLESTTQAPESAGPDGSLYGMFASTELEQQTLSSYWQFMMQKEQAHCLRMLQGSPFMFGDCRDEMEQEQKRFFVARFLRRSLYCVEDALEKIQVTCEWLSLFAFRALDRSRVERLIDTGALYFHGYDRRLRPILVCRVAKLDWMTTDQVELLVAYMCFFFGRYLVVLGKVEQMTLLLDTNLLNRGSATQQLCTQNLGQLLKTMEDHFPYFVGQVIATSLLPFPLERASSSQVLVVPKEDLHKLIDTHQLEESLGGIRPDAKLYSQPIIYNPDLQAGKLRLVIDGIFCHGRVFLPPADDVPELPDADPLPPSVLHAFRAEIRDFDLGYSAALARDHFRAAYSDIDQAITSFKQAAEIRRHIPARYEAVDKKWSGWRSFRWSGRDRLNRPVLVVELKSLMNSNGNATMMEGAVGWYINFGLNHLLTALPRHCQQFNMLVDSAGVSALMLPLRMSSLCNYLQLLLANRLCSCFVFNTNFTLRRAWDALCASMRKSVRSKIIYVSEAPEFQLVKKAISATELEVALGGKWKPSALTRTGTSPICIFPSNRSSQLGTEAAIV